MGGGRGEGAGERVGKWCKVPQGGEPGLPKVLGVASSAVKGSTGSDQSRADDGTAGSGEVEEGIMEKSIGGEVQDGMEGNSFFGLEVVREGEELCFVEEYWEACSVVYLGGDRSARMCGGSSISSGVVLLDGVRPLARGSSSA